MSLTLWQPKSEGSQPLPQKWVEELYKRLLARYGTLFADRYAGVPMPLLLEEWGRELAGFTPDELSRGLSACRTKTFPPTLPEFMQLCRPPLDCEVAYAEAVRNMQAREAGRNPEWTNPAIYWAVVDVGWFDMRQMTYPQVKRRWEAALTKAIENPTPTPIPPPQLRLPEPAVRKPNPEVMAKVQATLARLRTNASRSDRDDADEPT